MLRLQRLLVSQTTTTAARRSFASLTPTPGLAIIQPSPTELKGLALNPRNLETAVRHLHEDGLVVVEDVVPHDHLDKLNTKMVRDAKTLQARGDDGPFNYNKGNIQQDAPPVAEYFFPSVFTSKPRNLIHRTMVAHRNRSHRNANHLRRPRPPAQMDLLLRKLGHALCPGLSLPTPACALGRRLCVPIAPLRPRRQRAPRHHHSRQRLDRALGWHALPLRRLRPGRRPRGPRQRPHIRIPLGVPPTRPSAGAAGHQEGQRRAARLEAVARGHAQ